MKTYKIDMIAGMDIPTIEKALTAAMPELQIEIKKNPLLKFEYVQVQQSAFIGTWVRIMEKKNQITFMGCIPATWARALFNGLLAILIGAGKRNKLSQRCMEVVQQAANNVVVDNDTPFKPE